ncbi:uncharacterized protein LOC101235088 isoform X2 [Hydra vulgaris]|uniref:uncharacterized protein LOC101235088 isoform X2 n=1 Tax=Hydra vulgaris TaxID=6087 RepID=UPI0032E9EEF4
MMEILLAFLLCVVANAQELINQKNQFALTKGSLIGILNVLRKEYVVSFNVKPISYSKGWKSVLHLTLDKDYGTYGDRNPGVWFHEDGSGKLSIFAAISGNVNYYVETAPLPLGQWSHIKICQIMLDGKYWFSVDLNGNNVHRVENSDAREFQNIKVYASDLWYAAQHGFINDLLIINGKAENILGNSNNLLVKGKLIAELPKLDKEYLISFDVYPKKFVAGWHSVIHFTIGADFGRYGDRVPGIWFHADGRGGLYISAPINGNVDRVFTTNPIGLNQWSNVEVSQILRNSVYVYTIRLNGVVVFSENNNQVQSFDNVKVYASDPWYEVQDGLIRNLFIVNGISNNGLQPIVVLPAEFINHRNELIITQGSILGTLNVLKKEYTVDFNVKPKSYSKGWKSVLHLTLGKDYRAYGDRIPGVWFHEDGSGKLTIFAAVSGNNNYYVETTPLPLNQWSHVKISQYLRDGKYWFSVDLNGVNIHRVENSDARDFQNIKVYASDPWYARQDGSISNLQIINGNAQYLVGSISTTLVKGKLIAELPKLDKEYLVSFDVYPKKFVVGWHSVIHFSIGADFGRYGDRVPGIWFHADGRGDLYISAPINGNVDRVFTTNPIGLNQWSNVEVSQVLRNSVYVYTIRLNGVVVFSENNNQVQSFDNVKVYASDPWYEVQDGLIRNLFIINGISNNELQPVIVLPAEFINHRKELIITQGSILGTLNVLKKEYTVDFNVKPKSYSKGWKSVLHLTLGKDYGAYGDRIPGVWFHEDGSGKLTIFAAVSGNNNYYVETTPLPLNQWSHVKISQYLRDGKYWFSVDLNGVNIHRVENSDARDFQNIKVYASDPWYARQDGSISNLQIINGNAQYLVGSISTTLVKGKLIAELPKLDKEYLVSFDVYPKKFVVGWHSVIHFSIGTDFGRYGDRVPGIWFHADGRGDLYISAPINGNVDRVFTTNPIGLNQWSNVEVSQVLRNSVYVYTIRLNGVVVFSENNNQVQSFDNVKVYASDPWYEVQDGLIRNLFIINGISNNGLQPAVILPTDYISRRNELVITQGSILGTLNVLKKEYTVEFNLKPKSYTKGWKSVLHLTLGKDFGAYGDRNPGVWFHEDGSGKLSIFAAVNGNNNYYVETAPLPLNQWSHIKICQSMRDGKYWFSVYLNGANIHKVANSEPRDFTNMVVYASDLWYAGQDGSISNLRIFNGNAQYLVGVSTPLVKGKLIAKLPKLEREYLVSFDVYPNKFVAGWHSVIHFSIGSDLGHYGDRVPGIWFHADGRGGLYISAPINGNVDRVFTTNPVGLNQWSNVEISQILRNSVYVYTIRLNGEVVFSENNNQVQSFDNVKVYASDPWYDAQDGSIRNLFVVNGASSNDPHLYGIILPRDFIDDASEIVIKKNNLVATLVLLKRQYSVSFELKPTSYQTGWHSVLHMTIGQDLANYGDRIPGVWFHEDGSGKLLITSAINGNKNYFFTTTSSLPLNQWSKIEICQRLDYSVYVYEVSLNGNIIFTVRNNDARDFQNVKVYLGDQWYSAQTGSVKNLKIVNKV